MGRRSRNEEPPELDVTTFMNLMVVLIPVLLLTAAFSEFAIHDLNLPSLSQGSGGESEQKKLNLEIIIRKDMLDVIDRGTGRLKMLPNLPDGHDFKGLTEKLKEIKSAYPKVTSVTLLVEPDMHYEKLILTMDAVRSYAEKTGDGKPKKIDLFPDVSIGDAPKVTGG